MLPALVVLGFAVGAVLALATVLVLRQAVARGHASDRGVVALVVIGLAWQQANSPIEGVVLWTVTPSHGLVLADLAAAPAAAIVVGHVLMRLRPEPRPAPVAVPAPRASDEERRELVLA